MSKSNSPYIKFTYTLIGLKGEPQEKSYMLNLSYIVSVSYTHLTLPTKA